MWTVKKQRNEIQFPAVFLKWLSSPDRLGKCKISRIFFRWKWVKKIIQVDKKNNHQRKGDRQNRVAKLHFRKVKSFNRVDRSFRTYQTSLKAWSCDVVWLIKGFEFYQKFCLRQCLSPERSMKFRKQNTILLQ